MNLGALICLLLAHFTADFPLQFQHIIKLRNDQNKIKSFYGNILHSGIHLLLSSIFILYYRSVRMFLVVIAVAVTHFIIDYLKSRAISNRPFRKYSINLFLLDQIAHLVCIFMALYIINTVSPIAALFRMQKGMADITYNQKFMLSMTLLIIGLWGTGVFIRIVLGRMASIPYRGAINLKIELVKTDKHDGTTDGGFIIGILERLFIVISIVLNMPLVIGFILTVKSVARLKKFDDERFVEIFIIGSFISFISAIIIGYIIKFLRVIPY